MRWFLGAFCAIFGFSSYAMAQGCGANYKVLSVVICGDQDPITPVKRHDFMAGMIPNAQLRVLENTGHFPTIEAPSETNAVLRDWLAQPYVLR